MCVKIMVRVIYSIYGFANCLAISFVVQQECADYVFRIPMITNSLHIGALGVGFAWEKCSKSYTFDPWPDPYKMYFFAVDVLLVETIIRGIAAEFTPHNDCVYQQALIANVISLIGVFVCYYKTMMGAEKDSDQTPESVVLFAPNSFLSMDTTNCRG